MLSLKSCRVLVAFFLIAIWACVSAREALSQCVLPNKETTTCEGSVSNSADVYGEFYQVISNTAHPTVSYSGDQVEEAQGKSGTNLCYYTGSPLGKSPGILVSEGPSPVGSSDQWGYDDLGLTTQDAYDIYEAGHDGMLTMTGSPKGCEITTYQDMSIKLRNTSEFQTYESNVEHYQYVYYDESLKACRETSFEYSCSGYIGFSEP